MRVLLTSTPGAGHLGPLVPFARAIRRAGHEVLLAAPVSAQARVERAGLAYLSLRRPARSATSTRCGRRSPAPRRDEANEIVIGELFAGVRARAALPGIELAMDAWRPHVVLRESCEFAGAVAAEARGIPHARVGHRARDVRGLRACAPPRRRSTSCARGPGSSPTRRASGSPRRRSSRSRRRRSSRPACPAPARTLRFHDAAPRPHAMPDPGAPPLVYVSFGSVAPTHGLLPRPLPRGDRRARRTCRPASSSRSATPPTRPSSARCRPTCARSAGSRRPRSSARRPRWSATAASAPRSARCSPASRRSSCRCSPTSPTTPSASRRSAPASSPTPRRDDPRRGRARARRARVPRERGPRRARGVHAAADRRGRLVPRASSRTRPRNAGPGSQVRLAGGRRRAATNAATNV